MHRTFILVVATVAAGWGLTATALASPDDYAFEPVAAQVKRGENAVVAVRLVHKATRKRITDAEIILKRIDMGPDGMGDMTSPLSPLPNPEPGVYAFKTNLTMAGRWLLRIAAKVPGEQQAVVGMITFSVAR